MKVILHVDLDAYYASVEQRDNPSLRGRPVIVGGSVERGVVAACSYEARKFGVRSAMPMAQAVRRCPHGVVLRPRMEHYAAVSEQFFAILHTYSPLVEGLSLDEAFLDVTGEGRLFGDGPVIARLIKDRVRSELGLVVSAGIAPTKFVAKIASDLGKPDGLLEVRADEVQRFLDPLPVGRLWGVGRVTEAELASLGLRTIAELRAFSATHGDRLTRKIGPASAEHLSALASGLDDRVVVPDHDPVSIGHEDTFDQDLFSVDELVPHLLAQGDASAARLRAQGHRARTITIKVKYADHRALSRRSTLPSSTDDARQIAGIVRELLTGVPDITTRGVRLTGVSLSGFGETEAPRQLSLLDGAGGLTLAGPTASLPGTGKLDRTLDAISERFGTGTVRRAIHVAYARPRDGKK